MNNYEKLHDFIKNHFPKEDVKEVTYYDDFTRTREVVETETWENSLKTVHDKRINRILNRSVQVCLTNDVLLEYREDNFAIMEEE